MMDHFYKKITLFSSLYFLGVMIFSWGIFALCIQAAETIVVDRIVAVVNDDIITLFDLDQTFQPYEENIGALRYAPEKERKTLFKLRADLLNQLIDGKIADQQIKKNNIKISPQEIDQAIERAKQSRSYTDEDLRAGLAQQGLTLEEYRKNLKQQLLRNKLVNLKIKSKIVITEDEIINYYNAHREKYIGEKKYHLWNIFIRLSRFADESEKRLALAKMEAVITQLTQGRSFESLAAEAPDSALAPKGTDLGLYRLDELAPKLQAVAENMNPGEFTPILHTAAGYQIIYLKNVINANSKTLADVKPEIQEILYKEALDNKYNTWLEDLRKRSHIKIIK